MEKLQTKYQLTTKQIEDCNFLIKKLKILHATEYVPHFLNICSDLRRISETCVDDIHLISDIVKPKNTEKEFPETVTIFKLLLNRLDVVIVFLAFLIRVQDY